MSSYLELETQNKQLKELLQEAVTSSNINPDWIEKAKSFLNPPTVDINAEGYARWMGEECGDLDCGHSSVFHAHKGKGLCSRESCKCMSFVPTGKKNEQAR